MERDHKEHKKWSRLATLRVGYVCRACGDGSYPFADGRALKRHYLNRQVHSAKELIRVGVKLWANISDCPEDMEAVREVYEDGGIIEQDEEHGDDDSDYEAD